MKHHVLLPLLLAAAALPLRAAYGPAIVETDTEFLAGGDFNGDGRRDYVVIDRATGALRPAMGNTSGGFSQWAVHASGIPGVTGAALGRFLGGTVDLFALVCPLENRCNIVRATGGAPVSVFFRGVGPVLVTAVDLPGGTAGRHDLVGVTALNPTLLAPPPNPSLSPYYTDYVLNGASFTSLKSSGSLIRTARALPVVLDTGLPVFYAVFLEVSPGVSVNFGIFDTREATVPVITALTDFDHRTRAVYGPFEPAVTRSVFVFHVPGQDSVLVSRLDATFTLQAPITVALEERAEALSVVESNSVPYLAAVDAGGGRIRFYTLNAATGAINAAQSYTAPAGKRFTACLPQAGGGMVTVVGDPATGRSESFRRYNPGIGKIPFSFSAEYAFPVLNPESLAADVLLFDAKPFETRNARLTGRLRAGGWTSTLNDNPAFSGSMYAYREGYRGPEAGLGDPQQYYLGIPPADVRHGLANQIAPNMSVVSLEPASGFMADLIRVDPPGGPQAAAVEMTLAAADPATVIRYSVDVPTNWHDYHVPVGPLIRDVTVYYYGIRAGAATPIRQVTYTFPANPAELDSDNDGVPDFVEEYAGLDPLNSGSDSDLDGVNDLVEILAGTDPLDDLSFPSEGDFQLYVQRARIQVTPYSHPGVGPADPYYEVPCLDDLFRGDGTLVSVYRPDGTLEVEGLASTNRRPAIDPRLRILNHPLKGVPRYLVAATPNRFKIAIAGFDKLRGREIAGLLTFDTPAMGEVPFTPDPAASPADQALAWIEAARAHYLASSLISSTSAIRFQTTVDLLLLERCLAGIFHARGLIAEPKLTLTPFRGDTGRPVERHPVTDDLLATLPEGGHGDPGYDWNAIVSFIRTGYISPTRTRASIDAVAREIYRIGYAPMDPEDPVDPGPFDALRRFIETGTLPLPYTNRLLLNAKELEAARNYVAALPPALPRRAYNGDGILLVAGAGTYAGSPPVMTGHSDGLPYWLHDALGRPFSLPTAFSFLPGSRFLATGHLEPQGSGHRLLVDAISLVDSPLDPGEDRDKSLLKDGWESFHFGRLGVDPFADHDGDGYTTLQEYFENRDPRDPHALPGAPVADLRMPVLHIWPASGPAWQVAFQWSPQYQHRVVFKLESGERLDAFDPLVPGHPLSPAGQFLFEHVPDDPASVFYRVGMELR